MTDKKFWKLVAIAKWPKQEYDISKAKYRKLLSREECKEFRKMVAQKYNELDHIANSMELPVSDDGYSDLLNHIIGLGEKEFNKHIKNHDLITKRADDRNYKESFSYAIPYDTDYEDYSDYTLAHVIDMAKSTKEEIARMRKMDSPNFRWLAPIQDELRYIEETMDIFLDNPEVNLKALASKLEVVKSTCDKIDKFFSVRGDELPRKFTDNGHNGMVTSIFSNTCYDAKKLFVYMQA